MVNLIESMFLYTHIRGTYNYILHDLAGVKWHGVPVAVVAVAGVEDAGLGASCQEALFLGASWLPSCLYIHTANVNSVDM